MNRQRPIKKCKVCNQDKPHEAFGMCKICYRNSKPKKICERCGKKYLHGYPTKCYSCIRYENGQLKTKSTMLKANERNFIKNGVCIFTSNKGNEFTVDADIYEKYKTSLWQENHKGYAVSEFNSKSKSLHKIILPNATIVDHIDGNKKNCLRSNLRAASFSINARNRDHTNTNSHSKYIGVRKSSKKWVCKIWFNKKNKYLGSFDTEEEAHQAWIDFVTENNLLQYYRNVG